MFKFTHSAGLIQIAGALKVLLKRLF